MKRWSRLLFVLLAGLMVWPAFAGPLTMTDHRGELFELRSQRGQVLLVLFGYTRCPDICPMGLSIVSRALNHFSARQQPVKGLFVSVDRERDNPEVLDKYLSYFSPELTGLTGNEQQLQTFADFFSANYQITKQADASVKVDHSANLYVIDQAGVLQTIIPFGLGEEHIIKVVVRLLGNSDWQID